MLSHFPILDVLWVAAVLSFLSALCILILRASGAVKWLWPSVVVYVVLLCLLGTLFLAMLVHALSSI